MMRNLSAREWQLIEKLLSPWFPGRDQVLQQLRNSQVRQIDEDGGLEIQTASQTEASEVMNRIPAEGEYEDPDGITVHVLLHVVSGKVNELEFYREDGTPVQSWPEPDSVRVFAPG